MKDLKRADVISLMNLEYHLYMGHWTNLLSPRYREIIDGVAPYHVFRCLMGATAQAESPDMAYFEEHMKGLGVKRQTISKYLNIFIKEGMVNKSSWDKDKRNSIYTFSDTAIEDLAPVLMQGLINNVDAFTRYTSSDGDVTPRVLQILAERDATAEMLETSLFENYGVPSNVYALMRSHHIRLATKENKNKKGDK